MKTKGLRLIIDVLMTMMLLLLMSYEMVGSVFGDYELGAVMHEVIGITFVALVLFHLWLNRHWLRNIFKGKYSAQRALLVFFDILLILDIIFLLISGIIMSRLLDLILQSQVAFDGIAFARTMHILAAYWGFVIMSLHIGFHWRRVPLLIAVAASYGAYAFIKRNISEYMFLNTQFVFFNFEEPIIYFIFDYFAIMLFFACLGYCLMSLFRKQ